jgi:hypothetical protein
MTKINTIVKIAVSLAALGVVNQANATWYTIGDGGLEWGWNLNIDGFYLFLSKQQSIIE